MFGLIGRLLAGRRFECNDGQKVQEERRRRCRRRQGQAGCVGRSRSCFYSWCRRKWRRPQEGPIANGDAAAAISSYQSAILGAGKSSYINEEALSYERAGLFLAQEGEITEARNYLRRAETLYSAWGAHRKVQDVSWLIEEHCHQQLGFY